MKMYVGTKIIQARPHEQAGKAGYAVMFTDGHVCWLPEKTFELCFRVIDDLEIELMAAKRGSHEETGVKVPAEDPREQCAANGHKWRRVAEWNNDVCSVCDVLRSRVE